MDMLVSDNMLAVLFVLVNDAGGRVGNVIENLAFLVVKAIPRSLVVF